jgi:hypothetical protein
MILWYLNQQYCRNGEDEVRHSRRSYLLYDQNTGKQSLRATLVNACKRMEDSA